MFACIRLCLYSNTTNHEWGLFPSHLIKLHVRDRLPFFTIKIPVIIPRETRGYRFQLFSLSICPSVRLRVQAISPKVLNGKFLNCTYGSSIEGVQRRVLVRFNKNMLKWQGFENVWKLRKYSSPCPGYISQSIHWSVIVHPYTDKPRIEGVQRRVLDKIYEKLSKLQTFVNS